MATHGAMPAVIGRADDSALKLAELSVEGMTCAACSGAVERALKQMNGVEQVEVNLLRARAQVHFLEGTATAEQLVDEIELIGFDASILSVTSATLGTGTAPNRRVELSVQGMTCAACSGAVERALRNAHSGILDVQVNLLRSKAVIRCTAEAPSAEAMAGEVEDCGFEAKVISENDEATPVGQRLQPETAKLHVQANDPQEAQVALEKLEKMPGILNVVIFQSCCLRISYRPDELKPGEILRSSPELEHLALLPLESASATESLKRDLGCALPPTLLIIALVFILPLTGSRFLDFDCGIPGLRAETLLLFCLATPVQCYCGRRFHRAAKRALKRRAPNMDVLISTATCLAYGYSTFMMVLSVAFTFLGEVQEGPPPHFFETPCSLITVVLIGRLLEAAAKQRTTDSLDELVRASPPTARVNGEELPIELVALGDVVEILPGEVAPVDGELLSWDEPSGTSGGQQGWSTAAVVAFDESLLTGESRPVPKHQKDTVIGCSRHVGSSPCRVLATRVGSGSAVAQIVQLVEKAAASASTAPAQRFADAAATVFVPCVVLLAALTALVWFCMVSSGSVRMPSSHHWSHAFLTCEQMLFALKFGLSVLLVACPCAMGLATPTAVMVSTGVAARRGVLVKSAAALELTARRGAIVLDKTGTLTLGRPGMVSMALRSSAQATHAAQEVASLGRQLTTRTATSSTDRSIAVVQLDRNAQPVPFQGSESELLGLCILLAASASHSEHPLSRGCEEGAAQVAGCTAAMLLQGAPEVSDFEVLLGVGVKFRLGDLKVSVGFLEYLSSDLDATDWAQGQRSRGCSIVAVQANGILLGMAALRDTLHPNAWQVIQELKDAGEEVWMCTGDHSTTAAAVADELGIPMKNVRAECAPAHKAALVAELQTSGRRVVFVGDGVNDAVALTAAEVGIAIGAGARLALEAADVVLVRSDLQELLTVKQLALATVWCIKRNFLWAFVFNLCMIPLAAGVLQHRGIHLPPAAAAAAMACSSIMVVSSSLLLRRFKPRRRRHGHGHAAGGAATREGAHRRRPKARGKKYIEMRPLTAGDDSPQMDADSAV